MLGCARRGRSGGRGSEEVGVAVSGDNERHRREDAPTRTFRYGWWTRSFIAS